MKSHASMNRIYRLVWNAALNLWVAVAENAKGQGKSGRTTAGVLATVLTALIAPPALAASAANALVSAGSGKVVTQGATTTITQTSQRLAIDWLNLSTTANEALVFNQPNAQAIALNRITGSSPSSLLGSLTANGQVFILNPNGVLFGAGAQVNVGSLVASTLRLDNANFMAGNYQFVGDANGSVINHGNITVAPGGTLALMAPVVQNTGTLSAPGGSVLLAGAQGVSLTLQPEGGLVAYTLDTGSAQAMVDNGGLVQAGGGHVVLTAKGVDAMSKAVVNHSGVIEAQTVGGKNGVIELLGDMQSGTVNVSGKLDASAPNADGKGGDGGFIETSAANVKIANTTRVTTAAAAGQTGMWLIDPTDFTINSGGGSLPPSAGIAASTLSASLSITNATIATSAAGTGNGDIFVNSPVAWSANKLTLSAHGNININANLNGTGTAKLALNYGQASADGAGSDYILASGAKVNLPPGQNFSTKQGNAGAAIDYTVITSLGSAGSTTGTDLQGINGNLAGNFALGSDIDASPTLGWANGAGFSPMGGSNPFGAPFSGKLNGLGHVVNNLTINQPATDYVGLFGAVRAGSIQNIGLVGGNIKGAQLVGALVGDLNSARISDSFSTINVDGSNSVGGLVGRANSGFIVNSYATGNVGVVGDRAGGLVGSSNSMTISTSFATGNITATGNDIGGLVGGANAGTIVNSYATGNVDVVGGRAGGLVGSSNSMRISTSFATGNITATGTEIGGFVGFMASTQLIDGYATGRVSGDFYLGGIAGSVATSQTTNFYSTGAVRGTSGVNVGGFMGYADASEIAAGAYRGYWDTTTSGLSVSKGGTGLATAQMQQQSTYTGWDFANTWRIVEGSSYPMLRVLTQGKIILASARDIEKVYDKTAWSGGLIDYSGFTAGDTSSALQGTIRWVGTAEGAINAGNYSLVPSGLYSQKYEVVYVPGTLTIQPRPVDVSVTKTYNGNVTFTSGFVASNGVLAGDTVSLTGSATVSSPNAGSYAAFSSNNLVSSNPNYTAKPQYVYTGALGKVAATIAIDPAIEAARLAAIAAAAEADRLAAIEAARVAELARQAAIVAEQARLAEVLRLAREGAAAEAARLAALEAARVAEVARQAAIVAEQARLAEVLRLAREGATAEAARLAALEAASVAEVARQAAIVAEQARLAEVIRVAREAAKAEADRVANANAAALAGSVAFSMTAAVPTEMYIAGSKISGNIGNGIFNKEISIPNSTQKVIHVTQVKDVSEFYEINSNGDFWNLMNYYVYKDYGGDAYQNFLNRSSQVANEYNIDPASVYPNSVIDRSLYAAAQWGLEFSSSLIAITDAASLVIMPIVTGLASLLDTFAVDSAKAAAVNALFSFARNDTPKWEAKKVNEWAKDLELIIDVAKIATSASEAYDKMGSAATKLSKLKHPENSVAYRKLLEAVNDEIGAIGDGGKLIIQKAIDTM